MSEQRTDEQRVRDALSRVYSGREGTNSYLLDDDVRLDTLAALARLVERLETAVTTQLDRLVQLAEAATPGPWTVDECSDVVAPDRPIALGTFEWDAEFIAACREWVPVLIQAARAAERLAGCAMHASPETEDAIEAVFAALAPLVGESAE